MNLTEFLQMQFSKNNSSFHRGTQLQRGYQELREAFNSFASGVANCKGDPQFFAESVSVDVSALKKGIVTLTVFGTDEIWFCLAVGQGEQGRCRGKVNCFLRRGCEIAKRGGDAAAWPLGSWEFDTRGIANIKLNGEEALNMYSSAEAIALAVGVFLFAYAEDSSGSSFDAS